MWNVNTHMYLSLSAHTGPAPRDSPTYPRRPVQGLLLFSTVRARKRRPSHHPSALREDVPSFPLTAANRPGKPRGAQTCQAQDRSRVPDPQACC